MSVAGKTILITGSTDGVGRFVAERLAAEGASLIVHGRDQARGEALVERIEKSGGNARFFRAELASLADVRTLAETVRRETDGLDVLVNNAGIGTAGGKRDLSADGFELRFAVNYLAGFLLTRLLLPLIEARAPSRIVNDLLGRAAADRLFRRDADPWLQRGQGLLPEQARASSVHDRSRRGAQGQPDHGQLPPSGDLYGHDHGAPLGRTADQHGG
jgi:NADP-dependent 3-hydroxy acid dehydrogenase YdfG